MLWPRFLLPRLQMAQTETLCRWMDKACPRPLSQRLTRHRQSTLIEEELHSLHLLIHCYQIVVNPTKAPDTRGLGNPRFLANHAIHPELGTSLPWRPFDRRQRDRRSGTCWRQRWRSRRLLSITRTSCPDTEVWWWFCHRCCLVRQQACGSPLDWSSQDLRQRSRGCQLRPPCRRSKRSCSAPMWRHSGLGWRGQELRPLRSAIASDHYPGFY